MLDTPQELHFSDKSDLALRYYAAQARSHQYGSHPKLSHSAHAENDSQGRLLNIPTESLAHITSYLDAKSLFSLGLTNKTLHEHVADDNTWRAAFLLQFLGKRPESTASEGSAPLLRRTEVTWKREFVFRQNLLRRWERSRSGTISHVPHHSTITEVQLLTDRSYGPALLSASLQHGIVARSLPLSGKVLKGYLSTNDGFGFGIGNPNVDQIPNMSASAISSQGWSVHVAWGSTSGEVLIASAAKVMDSGRSSSKIVRCRVADQHRGLVTKVAWDKDVVVSASSDGEVRIWEPKRMRCLWVLKDVENVATDRCSLLLPLLDQDIVIVVKDSGHIVVWTGIDDLSETDIKTWRPTLRLKPPHGVTHQPPSPMHAFFDPKSSKHQVSLCLHYEKDLYFYRIDISPLAKTFDTIKFGDGPLGPIQTLRMLHASSDEGGEDVIFAGDNFGRLSIFKWSEKPKEDKDKQAVSATRCMDIVPDINGGITEIAVNPYVLAVGTARGTVVILDTLTFNLLRELSCVPARTESTSTGIRHIILERDLILIVASDRVVAWKAGPVLSRKQLTSSKKATGKIRNVKWHKRVELAQDITESQQAEAEHHASDQRSYSRQRAQHSALRNLGLDEHEAVEYLLMLSRDEELAREQMTVETDDGVFAGDMEGVPQTSHPSNQLDASAMGSLANSSSSAMASPSFRPMPMLPQSNVKVQVTPPQRPEPMEAGGLSLSSSPLALGSIPRGSPSVSPVAERTPPDNDESHFPAINTGSSSPNAHTPSPSALSGSWTSKVKISPSSTTNPAAMGGPSSPTRFKPSHRVDRMGSPNDASSYLSQSLARAGSSTLSAQEQEEADLKLALELSLAEVMSLEDH